MVWPMSWLWWAFQTEDYCGRLVVALADAGGHKVRAQHAGANLVGNERHILHSVSDSDTTACLLTL